MNKYYYGLKWKRELGDWGHRGKRGSLIGKRLHSGEKIDCSKQIGFYVLYNNSEIVRISNSWKSGSESFCMSIYDCLKEHERKMKIDKWDSFSWFGLNREKLIHITSDNIILSQFFDEILSLILNQKLEQITIKRVYQETLFHQLKQIDKKQ